MSDEMIIRHCSPTLAAMHLEEVAIGGFFRVIDQILQ